MRTCPDCKQDVKPGDKRYIVTGLVNTPVYNCENCRCMFIACNLTGDIWGAGAYAILCPGKREKAQ
jgi:hypothetical protein